MIDLHTHTNYSDGTWSLSRILEEAQNMGVEILSITDHDTLKAYREMENIDYKSIYSGKIIPGIEFNTVYDGIAFHMLAYDFDYKELEKFVQENYESKEPDLEKEFKFMMNSCKKNNIKIDNIQYDKNKGWPIDFIFPGIKKYEENKKYFKKEQWDDIDVFFNSCVTNNKFPAFVDFSIHYPNARLVSETVKEAGGKLFIAHVYRYNLEDPINFLNLLLQDKILDGIEVMHSSFTKEQSKTLIDFCTEKNLLMSGGTDCHGDKKKDRKIGIGYGNMKINKELISNWN